MILHTQTSQDNELVVSFFGSLDAEGVQSIQEKLEALATISVPKVVLDLHEVDLIDSSGIGAIVFLYKRLKINENSLELTGIHGQPKILIQMLRIDSSMPVSWYEPNQPAAPERMESVI